MAVAQDRNATREMLTSMAKKSRWLSGLLLVALVVYTICSLFVLAISLLGIINGRGDQVSAIAQALLLLVYCVSGGLALYEAAQVFRDMSKSASPFSMQQAKRIRLVGWLLLFGVVAEAVISVAGFTIGTDVGALTGGMNVSPETTVLHINFPMLVSAVFCFCVSYVFKYGSLLQWVYDETI